MQEKNNNNIAAREAGQIKTMEYSSYTGELEPTIKYSITTQEASAAQKQKFNVGDQVDMTNDYGVRFPGKTIIGTEVWEWSEDKSIRYFIEPTDSPWFSVKEENLKLSKQEVA